jgi:murein L,D-transpeptidase YafK
MKQVLRLLIVLLLASAGSASTPSQTADRVVILKREHKLTLLRQGIVLRTYTVAIGRGGYEPKERRGDHRTPEGSYVIDHHKANSRFYRALHVSYPNEADRTRARKLGVDPGGDIMIHGIMNGLGWLGWSHHWVDWTDGCIALTDSEMNEVWSLVPDGTTVDIRP